jgi:geranylgeranyl reductase family protein
VALDHYDVVIIGGGPAGSSCAWRLCRAGLNVVVCDRAVFPRDKVCAGWITPQVIADLALDLDEYGARRTLQAITGFRVGVMGRPGTVSVRYGRPVSYGIRRCEFDDYLLRRSGAVLELGAPVRSIVRQQGKWVIDDTAAAPILVGAGGHWCPVARLLNPRADRGPVVAAQETEFQIAKEDASAFTTAGDMPELYFSRDFDGYGWIFRKQDHVNIGVGSFDSRACAAATRAFVAELQERGILPRRLLDEARWRGHAYLVSRPRSRIVSADGVLLVGDAAGLAYPQSGEGIRPAIESGLLAAEVIIESAADYSRERLATYDARLTSRFGDGRDGSSWSSRLLPGSAVAHVGAQLLKLPWFVRHVVLNRWFLRADEMALAA